MSDVVIRAVGLGKQYRIGAPQARYKTLRDTFTDLAMAPLGGLRSARLTSEHGVSEDRLWALKDVSFEIDRGNVVGIIGPNGAGKTTLLKVLSRITEPTAGYVEVKGRVGALLEVGTGFHPELTGRENVYLYGAILGMGKAEIVRKFDEIVAFADVERSLDTPVKHYSVGMQMRLAFAVAAHLEPEILLVDEALAVGDIDFQKKCIGSMESIANSGRTVLFVSHSMGLIESLCHSTLLIRDGSVQNFGATRDVVPDYLATFGSRRTANLLERPRHGLPSTRRFTSVTIEDGSGDQPASLPVGHGVRLKVGVWADKPVCHPWFVFEIRTSVNQLIFHCANREAGYDLRLPSGSSVVECLIPTLNLLPGRYLVNLQWWDESWTLYDEVIGAGDFEVREADMFGAGAPLESFHGIVFFTSQWRTYEDDVAEP